MTSDHRTSEYESPFQDTAVIAWLEAAGIDTSLPSPDRVYDAYLGGSHNTAIDRAFVDKVERILPSIKPLARSNRSFLRRAVQEAAASGITQFLDIGSGAPTVGNVHEIALKANPSAHVVYVDSNTIAVQTSQIRLEEQRVTDRVAMIQEDLRDPDGILDHPRTRALIDFDKPVCLLMVALLHFIGDEDKPAELIAHYRSRLAPGSKLALSHIASDEAPQEQKDQVAAFVDAYRNTTTRLHTRTKAEMERLFEGWELEEPGIVHPPDWRPDNPIDNDMSAYYLGWCGVGRKV
ncbi:SAM-dependent methyltransferase [Kibdelosporangium persicum]|uniref:O-methyltransferase involved in polyketide biosynthesis n=1 Tax=Kibdelosporangium persicum TaxID=2698649 RepID=A0ABX2EWI2_9PSEU|nr:SAM-dependent methyltransferase [Kibdelosporangium persicum]NRN63385.1 O-methyltransferase involved in polyketide biosynthesis [Kibdelosporangium persicum]